MNLIQVNPTTWINPESVDVVQLNQDGLSYRVTVGATTFGTVPKATVENLLPGFLAPANLAPPPPPPTPIEG